MPAKETKMKLLKIKMPIGEAPPPDPELERRIKALPKGHTIADVFKTITEWEEWAVKEDLKTEKRVIEKGLSGKLDYRTCLRILK
jgi:hypothetical protein